MPTLLEWPAMIKANHNSTYPGVSNDLFPTVLCDPALSVSLSRAVFCSAAGVAPVFEGKKTAWIHEHDETQTPADD